MRGWGRAKISSQKEGKCQSQLTASRSLHPCGRCILHPLQLGESEPLLNGQLARLGALPPTHSFNVKIIQHAPKSAEFRGWIFPLPHPTTSQGTSWLSHVESRVALMCPPTLPLTGLEPPWSPPYLLPFPSTNPTSSPESMLQRSLDFSFKYRKHKESAYAQFFYRSRVIAQPHSSKRNFFNDPKCFHPSLGSQVMDSRETNTHA